MKARQIILVALIALAAMVALTTFAFAAPSDTPVGGNAAHQAMHSASGMQQMHARMPAALQAQCNAMHAQMGQMHKGMSGMMGGGSVGGSMMGR